MKTSSPLHLITALATPVILSSLALAQPTTGWNKTAGGTYDYNDTANWVDGDINGLWDAALTLAGAQTIQFSANTILETALDFQAFGSQNITLQGTGGARTITLGGDITSNISINKALTIGSGTLANNLNVNLGGVTRTFTAGSSKSLTFKNVISNGAVSTYGGTIAYEGVNTYSGDTTVNTGILALNGSAGSAANSDFTVITNGSNATSLQFNSNTNGNTGTTRAKSVALNGTTGNGGAFLTVTGNSTANSVDVITNALTASGGYSVVSVSPNGSKNARLEAGSFVRTAGSTTLFRGTDLGVSTSASQTAGDSNIIFGTGPSLVGGAGTGGSTTVSILKGAFGEIVSNGTGSTGGLVTYDSTYGIRRLNTSEYTAAIVDGQTQLDNVLYSRGSGTASQNINLTAALTTINSLSFNITGAGTNSGVTISGDTGTTLKINSGMIFANQSVTTVNATDAIIINAPTLDLNGQEGVILAFTTGVSNGNTAAPLQINSSISNDGGKGLTIGGTGQVIFGGSSANTYTGPTTLNSGILRLNKTTVNSLTSDLIMNGGLLLKASNTIIDTASLTINGGTFTFDSTTSSGNNGHQETINNFTMNGGSVSNHGSNAAFTINGDATLTAGNLIMNQGGDITVGGTTTLSGGLLTAKESSSTSVYNGLTSLNTVNISNTASGAYTAISLTSHATNKGAQLTLSGNLSFTGNNTNTNTVKIASSNSTLANQGIFRLEGIRTFTIGNGAAAADLTIETALTDGTVTGGLVKTGLGTLALSGVNTYTGATTVSQGTLALTDSGALNAASALTVAAGATFDTSSQAAYTFSTAATTTLGVTASSAGLIKAAAATFTDATLVLDFGSATTLAASYNLFAIIGAKTGHFDSIVATGTTFDGDFEDAGSGVWTLALNDDSMLTFNEGSGILTYSTATVPEPSTFALLGGLGVMTLALTRRRNPRHAA